MGIGAVVAVELLGGILNIPAKKANVRTAYSNKLTWPGVRDLAT